MHIVIIDDLDLERSQIASLRKMKNVNKVTVYDDKPSETEAAKRAKPADILVTNTTNVTEPVMKAAPSLKMIAAGATGAELIVDMKAAKELGIIVTNIPHYATESVAELSMGLMLSLIRKIKWADQSVCSGNNDYRPFLGTDLKGKTLGIIGLGAIGSRVAELGQALGMKVIANDIRPVKNQGVRMMTLQDLLKQSDVISLHCDLNNSSRGLIGREELALLKPTAILINAARESIIEEKSLIQALKKKQLAGLAMEFDILKPDLKGHPLLKLDNVILTPHMGFFTKEALARRKEVVHENIKSYVLGKPQNVYTVD